MIDRCPRCRYLLHALPEVYPCPECGLVCDQAGDVFVGRRTMEYFLLVPGAAAFLLGLRMSTSRRLGSAVLCAVLLVLGVVLLVSFVRRPRYMTLVDRLGIRTISSKGRADHFDWESVGAIEGGDDHTPARLMGRDGQALPFDDDVLGGESRQRRFVRCARAAQQRWGSGVPAGEERGR